MRKKQETDNDTRDEEFDDEDELAEDGAWDWVTPMPTAANVQCRICGIPVAQSLREQHAVSVLHCINTQVHDLRRRGWQPVVDEWLFISMHAPELRTLDLLCDVDIVVPRPRPSGQVGQMKTTYQMIQSWTLHIARAVRATDRATEVDAANTIMWLIHAAHRQSLVRKQIDTLQRRGKSCAQVLLDLCKTQHVPVQDAFTLDEHVTHLLLHTQVQEYPAQAISDDASAGG